MFREPLRFLTPKIFDDFLRFEKNRHWTGLSRQKPKLMRNFKKLQQALDVLVNEEMPLPERMDTTLRLDGMGPGIATPILFTAYPDRYAVWNSKSESGLKVLALWPDHLCSSEGEKYVFINRAIVELRDEFNRRLKPLGGSIDLWTIDAYWHILRLFEDDGGLQMLCESWYAGRK